MTKKLLVKQGGGAASEVDYAGAFTPRKGAPFLDQSTPLIQMGQRFANGESAQGYFKIVDPDAELPGTGFRLRPWSEVRLTDDASGDELTLAWMRLSAGDVGRAGPYIGGDEIEHSPQLMDCNLDLRGIPFRVTWHRDAETDEDRLNALKTAKLNGSSSTRAVIRDTTDITIASFGDGHLCDFSSPVDLSARNFKPGTDVVDIIAEIAEEAGKMFGVVLHHTGGSTHKCLLYIDQDDLTSWTSAVRISDDIADWDPDDPTAPTFEPHWVQGSGKEANYEQVVSGIISLYNGSDDDTHAVYVETGEAPEDWETFVGVYNDDKAPNLTPATRRANWQLNDRKRPYISHRVSIIVSAAQAHLVEAGQAIQTKSVVLNSGPDKDSWVTRRVAQKIIEPIADGRYWLHLSLERPRMSHGANGGRAQPKGTSPKPAPEFEPDPGDTEVAIFKANDPGGDTLSWDGILPNQGGSGDGANGTDYYYYKSNSPDVYSHTRAWSEGDQLRVSGYIGCRTQVTGHLSLVFTDLAPGTNGSSVTSTTILGGPYSLSPTQPDHSHANEWTLFSAGPFEAPAGTTSYALGRIGGTINFDEVSILLAGSGGDVENDEHAIDYGDCPHDSPHFLPSDYVECRLDDLQTQIGEGGESIPLRYFNVEDYGAIHDATTDDTAAIQAAIDACVAAGGGTIFFPPNEDGSRGVYLIDGALQDTGTYNSQLEIPEDAGSVRFLGPATLRSTWDDTISGNPSVISFGTHDSLSLNQCFVTFERIRIEVPVDPKLSAIDATKAATVRWLGLSIAPVSSPSALPTHSNAVGLDLPYGLNDQNSGGTDLYIDGYYTGIRPSEQMVADSIYLTKCTRAVEMRGAEGSPEYLAHSASIQRLNVWFCERGIVFTGDPRTIAVDLMDVEHNDPDFETVYDIDDASNFGRGFIRYHTTDYTTGVPIDDLLINGGTNLSLHGPYFKRWRLADEIELPTGTNPSSNPATGRIIYSDSSTGDLTVRKPDGTTVDLEDTGSVSGNFVGPILISDTPSTPLVFADLIQNEAQDDLVYADP